MYTYIYIYIHIYIYTHTYIYIYILHIYYVYFFSNGGKSSWGYSINKIDVHAIWLEHPPNSLSY